MKSYKSFEQEIFLKPAEMSQSLPFVRSPKEGPFWKTGNSHLKQLGSGRTEYSPEAPKWLSLEFFVYYLILLAAFYLLFFTALTLSDGTCTTAIFNIYLLSVRIPSKFSILQGTFGPRLALWQAMDGCERPPV